MPSGRGRRPAPDAGHDILALVDVLVIMVSLAYWVLIAYPTRNYTMSVINVALDYLLFIFYS